MLYIYSKLDALKTHVALNFIFCVIITSVVNTAVYYGLMALTLGSIIAGWQVLLGSFLGEISWIALGLISYYINTHLWIPKDLLGKYVNKSCYINDEATKQEQIDKND